MFFTARHAPYNIFFETLQLRWASHDLQMITAVESLFLNIVWGVPRPKPVTLQTCYLNIYCSSGKASSRSSNCPRLLLSGEDDSHTRHLGPAILHALEHLPCHVLDITTLFEVTGRAVEEAIIQVRLFILMVPHNAALKFHHLFSSLCTKCVYI